VIEVVASFLIVLAFALGFFVGKATARPHTQPKRIAVNEDEDMLFDRLEALRRARFAPQMKQPEISPQLAARFKKKDR
jgi:hypothetical protein